MYNKVVLGLMMILSFYAVYDLILTKKYEWITMESKIGLGFSLNVLTISSLITSFQINEMQFSFPIYIALLIIPCILIQYLTTYFAGFRYKIPYPDIEELSSQLKIVLRHHGYNDVEQVTESRKNKFLFLGEKKSIELEVSDGFISKTNYHYLKFKRWTNRESREAITEALDAKLERYEPKAPSILSKSFDFMIILIFIIGFSGVYNYQALQPRQMLVYDTNLPPKVLMLPDYDILVTDQLSIISFENQFKNNHGILSKNFTSRMMGDTIIKVNYEDAYKTLFIGANLSYLYVDFEKMKNESSWDHFMVTIYELYGDKEGVYYLLSSNESIYDDLIRIIQEN